jgi:23S rRNA U2552 (ribose-2'-O)-methylase RlmE/FtsJ
MIIDNYDIVFHKLPKNTNNILKYDSTPQFSSNIEFPLFSAGFHHFIHQSKDKMEITKQFDNKKKVYYVMNNFERYVDDYENSIGTSSQDYFSLNKLTKSKLISDKPNILSRAFYKLWEILFMFDIVHLDKNFVSMHLAEGPGSFIQATMFYRDMFSQYSKNDKFYAVTIHPENFKDHIPPLEEKFVKYYEKENPQRFIKHKTYSKKISGGSIDKDNGDLTDPKTIRLLSGGMGSDKADLVTADGGFNWKNENIQEQEAFTLILAQIIAAVKVQKKEGHFVCKFFESFTVTTIKLVNILSALYKDVYAVKPFTSRVSNSEKYFVCMGFFGISDKEYSNLENILTESSKNKQNIVDIYPKFNFDNNLFNTLVQVNIDIANKQFININEIIDFINKQNYRGDVYTKRREMQIDASKFWTNLFFPPIDKFQENRQKIKTYLSL